MPEPNVPSCPTRDELEALAAGALVAGAVSAHVESCPRCRETLRTIEADNALLGELRGLGPGADDAPPVIPGYRIMTEIGRGSQGVVYAAEQLATRRTVAVKVLRARSFATTRQRRRFEREVEVIASLRHPGVVTVFDGGRTAAGDHYLAMEHIDGVGLDDRIARFAADADGEPMLRDARAALRCFAGICDAVKAAHQRGIIHRDLKPANVLVDEADAPHVLDFGLAKLRDDEDASDQILATKAGEFMGTFAYAAPEQVSGDPDLVDTRSDVYAMGVILYEMLTGVRPHDASGSVADVIRRITEDAPIPPSRRRRAIDDELETIVLRAMAKDPDRRYQSAAALLRDVEHYLAGEPIDAKRDSTSYLIRKMIARHRVPVVAAAAFAVIVPVLGVTLAWNAVLQRSRENSRQLHGATIAALIKERTGAEGADVTIEDFLDTLDGQIGERFAAEPTVAAPLRLMLGEAYLAKVRYDDARAQFELASSLGASLSPGARLDVEIGGATLRAEELVALAHHDLGRVAYKAGDIEAAETHYRAAMRLRRAMYGGEHVELARTMSHLAACLRQRARYGEAERLEVDALAMRRALLPAGHEEIGNGLNGLGLIRVEQERFAEAAECFREALDIVASSYDANDWRVARASHNLGRCLLEIGDLDDAEARLEHALAVKRSYEGETHPRTLQTVFELARLALRRGDVVAARRRVEAVVAGLGALFPEGHADLASALHLAGEIEHAAGATDAARARFGAAAAMRRDTLGAEHPDVAESEGWLARLGGAP